MSSSNPTIVIIPGGWTGPEAYGPLCEVLNSKSYPTVCKKLPSLAPSTAADARAADITADAKYIREELVMPLLSQGKDVVLVMHSYGGMPGGAAVKSLTKREGKASVLGLIWMAAFMVPEGMTMLDAFGGQLPPWIKVDPEAHTSLATNTIEIAFHDLPAPVASQCEAGIQPHSLSPFLEKVPYAAWMDPAYKGKCGYIYTPSDKALPPQVQQGMIAGAGVPDNLVVTVDASHSLFLSKTEETADAITKICGGFAEGR